MSVRTRVPAVTAVALVGLALATGPPVGLSLTAEPGPAFEAGTGAIDATVTGTPDAATIERGDFGADVYHLVPPPVGLRVSSVDGQPTVGYELAINGLGFSRTTMWVFDRSLTGPRELRPRRATLPPDRVDADGYDATLRVFVRDDAGERDLAVTDVRVEVVG